MPKTQTQPFSLEDFLSSADESFAVLDTQFHFVYFNNAATEAFLELHGKELEVGRLVFEMVRPQDVAPLRHLFGEVLKGIPREIQRSHSLRNNRRLVYRNLLRPLYRNGRVEGIVVHSRDITGQVEAEEALRAGNERFRRAAEASFDMIWEHDLRTNVITLSERYARVVGHHHTEVTAAVFCTSILHPDDLPMVRTIGGAFLRSTGTHLTYPAHRIRKADGTYLFVEARVVVLREEDGEPFLVTGVTHDVTEQREHELELLSLNMQLNRQASELQQSIDRYDLVSKATSDVVWDWNLQTNETWFNSNFEQLLGELPEQNKGSDIWESRLHPQDRKRVLRSVQQAIAEGRPHWEGEYRFLRGDGTWASIYDRGHTQYDSDGTPVRMIGSMQDITQTRELQEKIHRDEVRSQQRITEAVIRSQEQERATIGRELHDNINQVLTSCQLMTEMVRRDAGLNDTLLPRVHNQLGTAISEIRRLSHTLVQPALGDIGLKGALHELIDGHCSFSQMKVALRTRGKLELLGAQEALMLYRIAQEQLQNILKYAQATEVRILLVCDEREARLRITDNGAGFDPALRKEGIGIRNMRTRAQLCNGQLTLNTAPGKGCVLSVLIPYAG